MIQPVKEKIILGIDPGTTIMGYGVLRVKGIKPETLLHSLEEKEVYISTKSACSTGEASNAVFALTNDEEKAKTSIRISISKKTTNQDIDNFLKAFDESYKKLM